MDQRLGVSVALTPAHYHGDGITCACLPLRLMGLIFMVSTALHKQEIPPNTTNQEPSHNASDPHHPETQSEVRNQGENNDQETAADRPPESSGDHVRQDAHYDAQSERSRGERQCPDSILVPIDHS